MNAVTFQTCSISFVCFFFVVVVFQALKAIHYVFKHTAKIIFFSSFLLPPKNSMNRRKVFLFICCRESQIFKRNADAYRVMFSHHSLNKHRMLLLYEKIINLAIWHVSGMCGTVEVGEATKYVARCY